jgi:hypothetical protein
VQLISGVNVWVVKMELLLLLLRSTERDGMLIGVLLKEIVFVEVLDGDVKELLWDTLLWRLLYGLNLQRVLPLLVLLLILLVTCIMLEAVSSSGALLYIYWCELSILLKRLVLVLL